MIKYNVNEEKQTVAAFFEGKKNFEGRTGDTKDYWIQCIVGKARKIFAKREFIDYVINNDATQEELCKYVKEFAETINTSREPLANKFKVKYKDNYIIIDDAETFFSNVRLRIENGDLDLSEYDFFWARANDIIAPLTDIEQLFYVSSGKIIIRLEEVFDYHC